MTLAEVILQPSQPCWGTAKVSHNYWFAVNPPPPSQFPLLWDLVSLWLILRPFFRVSPATAPLHRIAISSPAPSMDGSREQLVKRDKVMFWVLRPSSLPCTAHPSAGRTMIEAGEAESRLKKAEALTPITAHTNTLNHWGSKSLWFQWLHHEPMHLILLSLFCYERLQNYILIILFVSLKHWWSL